MAQARNNLAAAMELPDQWQIDIAAMVSQLGCVTLPSDVADRAYRGSGLSEREQELVDRLPETSARLLENIPRMESVARIVAWTRFE